MKVEIKIIIDTNDLEDIDGDKVTLKRVKDEIQSNLESVGIEVVEMEGEKIK